MRLLSTLLLIAIVTVARGQHDHRYCATPDEKSEWLTEYQKNPEAYSHMRSANDTLYIALTVHNVGSELSNLFPVASVFNALCKLNEDFKPYKVIFYLKRPVRNIINATWNDHTFQQGNAMMQQNNFNDSANCYIVSNPAGACGYFSPSGGGVALSKSCLGASNTTWTHELGHFFSLPHTFLGWENVDYDPNKPTQTIEGNRVVELVDGSNCHFAGDGFCDTPPDYLSNRWICNNSGESNLILTDPKGETFRVDATLYMSYSDDVCTNRFSNQQVDAVRANMLSQNIRMTSTIRPFQPFQTSLNVSFITPDGIDIKSGENHFIQWEPVDQALGYIVQISRYANFTLPDLFTTTEVPEINIKLIENRPHITYYIRVRPLVPHTFCTDFSPHLTFNKVLQTSLVSSQFDSKISIFPNPLGKDRVFNINDVPENLDYHIITSTGQILKSGVVTKGNNTIIIDNNLPAGLAVLRLFNAEKQAVYKLLIQ